MYHSLTLNLMYGQYTHGTHINYHSGTCLTSFVLSSMDYYVPSQAPSFISSPQPTMERTFAPEPLENTSSLLADLGLGNTLK